MKKLLGIVVLGLLFFVQIPFIANAAKSSSIMDGTYQLTWGKKNVYLKKKNLKSLATYCRFYYHQRWQNKI